MYVDVDVDGGDDSGRHVGKLIMMKPSMASAVPNEKRHEMKKWEGNFCGPYLIYACIYLVRAQVSDACKVRLTFFPSICEYSTGACLDLYTARVRYVGNGGAERRIKMRKVKS